MFDRIRHAAGRVLWGSELPDPVIDQFGVSDPNIDDQERFLRLEAAMITTYRERARIIRLQRSQFWGVIVLGLVLCTSAFFFGRHLQHAQDVASLALKKTKATVQAIGDRHQALVEYQVASCKRGNETRVSDNRAHLQNYDFDRELIFLFKVSLAEPQQPRPELSAAQQASNLRLVRRFVGRLEKTAASLEWRSLIPDCAEAVAHPAKYVLPPPVKFTTRLPPPAALKLAPRE